MRGPLRFRPNHRQSRLPRSGGLLQKAKLHEGGNTVVETDLFEDLAVLHAQDRHAGEVHLASRRGGKSANQEVAERGARVRAAAFPAADDVVVLGDQVRGAPEVEVRKRLAEI